MKKIIFNNTEIIPPKVICVGRNYVEHIQELKNEVPSEIVLFIKPNVCITQEIILPKTEKCRYESEISFLLKNKQIIAVGFGLDLTLPEVQNRLKQKGLPWEKAKSFPNSAVFSEFIKINNIQNLSLEFLINKKIKQKGSIDLMIHKPKEILEEVEKCFEIEDYDILMTGTPQGIGFFKQGDECLARILEKDKIILEKKWHVKN